MSLFARNYFDPAFADRVAFSAISETVTSHTADRREFVGRNGTLSRPAALDRRGLGETTRASSDPCAALQCRVSLEPREHRRIVVLLGTARGEDEARHLIAQYGAPSAATEAITASSAEWDRRLSAVEVHTPDPEFDQLVNRWLPYQTLSCRLWGRSATYQSSGAYGFRDQLQDSMAMVYAEPALAREHLLRAAGRQFVEGDVQHWWHPHSGRGIRTRFSDDPVWLPYVVEHYVRTTGDHGILDEVLPFLSMRTLASGEHEVYDLPAVSSESAPLYEHCALALRVAATVGAHRLPLIGTGDWNDGMNRVGIQGKGESVWLAWFLIATLRSFAELAERRGDASTAADFRRRADEYVAAVEEAGWDGGWYRRAYFDDGTPLGSAQGEECRIDSIAQSWSVLSGAGQPERARQAMQAVYDTLVRKDARVVMLLTPPFDVSPLEPGYIKGYLPGVRENGAQYTHAALWAALAMLRLGDGDRGWELFEMLNPLTHAHTAGDVATYKVEPYVVAADVYTAEGHLGRGGWTWYTGAAAWMYRVALEGIMGLQKHGAALHVDPCLPSRWPEARLTWRHEGTTYDIVIRNPHGACRGVASLTIDGEPSADGSIPLETGRERVQVTVTLGPREGR
jgi:cyclic beta-1,2-glucan synthetase